MTLEIELATIQLFASTMSDPCTYFVCTMYLSVDYVKCLVLDTDTPYTNKLLVFCLLVVQLVVNAPP